MSERSRNILLAISLALNVFVIGAAAGGAYMFYAHGRPGFMGGKGMLAAAGRLTPDQRRAFRQILAQARQDSAADLMTARAGRAEVARLLGEDKLDRPAIDAELGEVRAADTALRSRLEQAVIGFAETLTPQERQRLVEGLRKNGTVLRRLADRNN